jgi:excinuclease ABC subunit A
MRDKTNNDIHLWGVKQNNLKNIDVRIPLGSFTVVCGPSGSGKSSLAFQTLFAEGQRRFIESLSHYARQFLNAAPKPDIEGVENIPPTISIEQKNSVKNSRSTVGTTTEIIDYLRLLYEKLGEPYCPTHHIPTSKETVSEATRKVLKHFGGERGYILVEVSAEGRVLEGKKLHALILQDSFLRIYIPKRKSTDREIETENENENEIGSSIKKSLKKLGKKTLKAALKVVDKKSSTQAESNSVDKKSTRVESKIADNKITNNNATENKTNENKTVEKNTQDSFETEKNIWTQESFGEIQEIGDPQALKRGLPKESFYLVIDRLQFTEDEKGRIADSINLAYETSIKYNTNLLHKRATIITTEGKRLQISEDNCCSICGYEPPSLSTKLFSFNNPYGACPTCKGFGNILILDEKKVIPNPKLSILKGALNPFTMPSAEDDRKQLLVFCRRNKIDTEVAWEELPKAHQELIWNGNDSFMGVKGLFEYLEEKKYKMHIRVFIARYRSPFECPDCKGSRLRKEVSHIFFRGYSINDLCAFTISKLQEVLTQQKLSKKESEVAGEVFEQLKNRINFLMRVGVHYLTLSRETRTLSGGEYQRLTLAHQLGNALSETLYVLDEPTVGLHPRDNDRLISILKELNALGNTLVVVEHDYDVIKSSGNIIEMGPGSGHLGGEIVFAGETKDFWNYEKSITAPYFKKGRHKINSKENRPVHWPEYKYKLDLKGATGHNLKHLDVAFPLHRLVVVTGVSGSGKSTLVTKTLYPALMRALDIEYMIAQPYSGIDGVDYIKNVVHLDQSAIGRSTRSNCLTYLKVYDVIRNIMASTEHAKLKGITTSHFSLNVDAGRCPVCKGLGVEEVEMMFMDNVLLPCEACDGKKFLPEVLAVEFQHKNIIDIMNLTVEEALNFFINYPQLRKALSFLKEVGLEYLRLGQSAGTLSGGESQRLKIARELSQVSQKSTLYILDEPTTGLHFREVNMLMRILHRLIDAGSSVIVVEHNMDVISGADYIIDLGPEGGHEGGNIVVAGTPEEVMNTKNSLTGKYLKQYLSF